MINKETIISVFDGKMTLMQWLKKVEEALKDASATAFDVTRLDNERVKFSLTFANGEKLETSVLIAMKGEKGDTGTSVVRFYINEGHLFVELDNEETQDLGLINDYSNVDFIAKTLSQTLPNWTMPIQLNYSGSAELQLTQLYSRIEVIGNILYIVVNFSLTNNTGSDANMGTVASSQITLPSNIASKLFDLKNIPVSEAVGTSSTIPIAIQNANVLSSIDEVNYQYNKALSPKIILGHVGRSSPNIISITITRNSNNDVIIPNGATWYFSARMFLTLM